RVLVTGAQGCIGAWVLKGLIKRGIDALVYDREERSTRLSLILSSEEIARLKFETGAIEDTARVKALIRDGGVTHIVHLAAVLMPYCQANPVAGGLINVIGTLNVFEAARDAGRPVRIVYASSSAVWGPEDAYNGAALTERDPIRPSTHYGVFKQTNEESARVFFAASGISSIGLRPWTVYGPGRDTGLTADPTLAIRAVARRERFQIRVTGFMDLQYVEDVAETFVRCLLSPVEGAHVFNLAGTVVDMEQWIGLLEQFRPGARGLISAAGPQVPVAYRMNDSALRSAVPDIPATPLEDGIRNSLRFYEEGA
ncbi:MAG: NAD-dependent epimerase/dehydratase family protein, partial [Bryobacteraceae bacterium]